MQKTGAKTMTKNLSPQDAQGAIVESELEDILDTMIDARCGLSEIHRLLDGAQTMTDVRKRFNAWQARQPDSQPKQS